MSPENKNKALKFKEDIINSISNTQKEKLTQTKENKYQQNTEERG